MKTATSESSEKSFQKKVAKAYKFACWQEIPPFPGYHVHLWIPWWLGWVGWLLRDQIFVTVFKEDGVKEE